MRPNEYHQQMSILLVRLCRRERDSQVSTTLNTKISIYCTIMEAQMTVKAAMILKRLNSNPLYAYHYKQPPIHAVDPLRSTQLEVDRSRYIVLYNKESYEEYLDITGEGIKAAGSADRAIQCKSIRPSMSFIGYGGIIDQETENAANVVRIRKHDYDDIPGSLRLPIATILILISPIMMSSSS